MGVVTTTTLPATVPAEPTTRERTPSDVLLAAARIIEEFGWWQNRDGISHDEADTLCAVMAIAKAGGYDDAQERFYRFIGLRGISDVFDWNDAPERTEAEVLAALRAAAR